ncbi:Uncharacterized protein dnm_063040 [Desulfonema magnum]|uniref:Uncharacterized protein n=1 Tax=Desulfonema magnum TaxID=45655 RepID=A0A975BRS4_9BACT|nr:Uncharacterized protein dnm_063040 [Desulfonema magnum]
MNGPEYRYGEKYRRKIVIHVVVCEETWEKVNKNAETEVMTSRHAWISSEPLITTAMFTNAVIWEHVTDGVLKPAYLLKNVTGIIMNTVFLTTGMP